MGGGRGRGGVRAGRRQGRRQPVGQPGPARPRGQRLAGLAHELGIARERPGLGDAAQAAQPGEEGGLGGSGGGIGGADVAHEQDVRCRARAEAGEVDCPQAGDGGGTQMKAAALDRPVRRRRQGAAFAQEPEGAELAHVGPAADHRGEEGEAGHVRDPARRQGGQEGTQAQADQHDLVDAGALAQAARGGLDAGEPGLDPQRIAVVAQRVAGAVIVEAQGRQAQSRQPARQVAPGMVRGQHLPAVRAAQDDAAPPRLPGAASRSSHRRSPGRSADRSSSP